jgi:hypothetical protein
MHPPTAGPASPAGPTDRPKAARRRPGCLALDLSQNHIYFSGTLNGRRPSSHGQSPRETADTDAPQSPRLRLDARRAIEQRKAAAGVGPQARPALLRGRTVPKLPPFVITAIDDPPWILRDGTGGSNGGDDGVIEFRDIGAPGAGRREAMNARSSLSNDNRDSNGHQIQARLEVDRCQ